MELRQPTFPRGDGPLVSVLLPTRGRVQRLLQSVDSLTSLAHNHRSMEFLFKIDDDDTGSQDAVNYITSVLGDGAVKVIQSPRGNGYHDMHLWFNDLSAMAKGDWLLVWNDDATMKTGKWDVMLENTFFDPSVWHGVRDICCFVPIIENQPGCTALFFLRRKVVELLGRFSAIPHCDTWMTNIMRSVDSLFFLNHIAVSHSQERDNVFVDGEPARTTTKYTVHNKGGTKQRLLDALKLQEYIDAHRSV